jgi:hypothetical protein
MGDPGQQAPYTPSQQSTGGSSSVGSRLSRGGSSVQGTLAKANMRLQEAYPNGFHPLNRESLKLVVDKSIRIRYPFSSAFARELTSEEEVAAKNKISRKVMEVLIVYFSNKLLLGTIHEMFPSVDTRSTTFSSLYNYAIKTFGNFKYELLWQCYYGQILLWLQDFGAKDTGDFRVDFRVWDQTQANIEHTTNWVRAHLGQDFYMTVYKSAQKILKWEHNFVNRTKKPYYLLKVTATSIIMEMAKVVVNEAEANPRLKWKTPLPSNWKSDKNGREEVSRLYESLCVADVFAKIEARHFNWLAPKVDDDVDPLVRPAAEMLRYKLFTDSPPPGSDSDRGTPDPKRARVSDVARPQDAQFLDPRLDAPSIESSDPFGSLSEYPASPLSSNNRAFSLASPNHLALGNPRTTPQRNFSRLPVRSPSVQVSATHSSIAVSPGEALGQEANRQNISAASSQMESSGFGMGPPANERQTANVSPPIATTASKRMATRGSVRHMADESDSPFPQTQGSTAQDGGAGCGQAARALSEYRGRRRRGQNPRGGDR